MLATERDINQIAEYADSSIRATMPMAPAMRHGSLPGIKMRRGFNEWLYRRWGNNGNAVYTFVGSLLTIALSGGVAWWLNEPFLFPSLGATAFLMFETPMAEVSSPRNAVIGHLVGAAIAYFWLSVFGLIDLPSAIQAGFTEERWIAIALSLAFTGGILRVLRAAHPPAGATTVIVALGLLDNAHQMIILAIGVLLVVIPAGILNRLMGVPAPLWVSPYTGFYGSVRDFFSRRKERRQAAEAQPPNLLFGAGPPLFGSLSAQLAGTPAAEHAGVPSYPPDWYPDPLGQAAQRYWDGRRWTNETSA